MPDLSVYQPLVSIVTPNFNGRRFIPRVIECVRQQNCSVEHIVVDDCSTDGSWETLQKLSGKYSWLKAVRLERNSGPVVARNKAIELAQGRFLAFLDVDDFWLPHKLKTQIDFMVSKNCTWCFTDYCFVSEDGRKIGRRLKGYGRIGWHLHHMTRYLGCLTIMIDRQKHTEFKFPNVSSSLRAEDFLAWSGCIQRVGPALRCPHDLARYAVVENSRSSSRIKAAGSVWRVYRDIEAISLHHALFYFLVYSIGVVWKRFWYRPVTSRDKVDQNFDWSLLNTDE